VKLDIEEMPTADAFPDQLLPEGAWFSLVLDLALRRAASCLAESCVTLWRSLGRLWKGHTAKNFCVQDYLARAPDSADDLPRGSKASMILILTPISRCGTSASGGGQRHPTRASVVERSRLN